MLECALRSKAYIASYAAFGDLKRTRNALPIESGQHWSHGTAEAAIDWALRFLVCSGAVVREWVSDRRCFARAFLEN